MPKKNRKYVFSYNLVVHKKTKCNMITKSALTALTYQINGACIEVHKALGPGLLENAYHKCLKHELSLRNIHFESQFQIPIQYKGIQFQTDLRCDLCIEGCIVLEIKALEKILPIHEAQLLTYMKLLEAPKGILINFNVANLYYSGQKTFVNELFRELLD